MGDFSLEESKWRTYTALHLSTKILIFLWKAVFGQAWFSLHESMLTTHSQLLGLNKFGNAPSPAQGSSWGWLYFSGVSFLLFLKIGVTSAFCQSLGNSPSCPGYHGKNSLTMSSNSFSPIISFHGHMYVQFKCYLTCFPSIKGLALSRLFICSQGLRFPKAPSTSKYWRQEGIQKYFSLFHQVPQLTQLWARIFHSLSSAVDRAVETLLVVLLVPC